MTDSTTPAPRDEFATIMRAKIAGAQTPADTPDPEEGPRRPRPDPSQASGANGEPTPPTAGEAFARALEGLTLPRGLWHEI